MAMGGVDKFDQLVSTFRVLRKTKKYWKTLFMDFVEVAVVNSYILCEEWRRNNPGQIGTERPMSQLQYRLNVVRQLSGITDVTPVPLYQPGGTAQESAAAPVHLPVPTDDQRNCFLCKGANPPKSRIACSVCVNRQGHAAHFCLVSERNCFAEYHRKA
eukprot:scpid39606/ scgid18392/ 